MLFLRRVRLFYVTGNDLWYGKVATNFGGHITPYLAILYAGCGPTVFDLILGKNKREISFSFQVPPPPTSNKITGLTILSVTWM